MMRSLDPRKERIVITGGSGMLGSSLRPLLPGAFFPSSVDMDIADREACERYIVGASPTIVIHAAAFTSPPRVEQDPHRALAVNIQGTAFIVEACMLARARLIYISTDYVFSGMRGMYKEDDAVLPINTYAWSKLGGECAARLYHNHAIIRTSFGPEIFPYEKAFVDQWTSRETVSVIAKKIVRVALSDFCGTIHVGGRRRTVYEFAVSCAHDVSLGRMRRSDVSFPVPLDTSLDCALYETMFGGEEL